MESDTFPSYPPLPPPASEEAYPQETTSELIQLDPHQVSQHTNNSQISSQLDAGTITCPPSTQASTGLSSVAQDHSSSSMAQHSALHSLHQNVTTLQPLIPSPGELSDDSTPSAISNIGTQVSDTGTLISSSSIAASSVSMFNPSTISDSPVSGSPIPGSPITGSPKLSSSMSSSIVSDATETTPNAQNFLLRLHYLEQLCISLKREKKTLEEDFGRQRKQFMNHITQSDKVIAEGKKTIDSLSVEVGELSTQLLLKDEEVKNLRIASKLSESQTREAFDMDRVKYEEEISSLRQILTVQTQEQADILKREREEWRKEKEQLTVDLVRLKKSKDTSQVGSRTQSPENNLEASMLKAALDAEILRAVVLPLEKEVESLKKKLAESEEKQRQTSLSPKDTAAAPLIELNVTSEDDITSPGGDSPIPTDIPKLQHQLKLARAACHDLEMHTKQTDFQKAILQDELASLRKQFEKLSKEHMELEVSYSNLKQTWELANQHFIVAQDKLKQENYHLHQKLLRAGAASPPSNETPEVVVSPSSPTNEERHEGEKEEKEGEVKPQRQSRAHRRSLSTEETVEIDESTPTQQPRSASWTNFQTAASSPEEVGELASRVVSLENELKDLKEKLVLKEGMCDNYEKQIHRVQQQMVAEMDEKELQVDHLKSELEKYKAGIMRERQQRQHLREQIDHIREEMGQWIETFQGSDRDVKQQLGMVKDKFTEIKHDTQVEIARCTAVRTNLNQQLVDAQEEYECLKVLQAQEMRQMTEMKRGKEEAELNLSTTMEQVSLLQSQSTAREENLRKEMSQEMEKRQKDRQSYQRMKSELTSQINALKQENASLHSLKEELESLRRAKDEAVKGKENIEEKSKVFIAGQQQQMEELNKAKETAEQHARDLQRQVSQLRKQLTSTEETQKDFVELSQSLQMKLAEIEDQKNQDEAAPSPTTPT